MARTNSLLGRRVTFRDNQIPSSLNCQVVSAQPTYRQREHTGKVYIGKAPKKPFCYRPAELPEALRGRESSGLEME